MPGHRYLDRGAGALRPSTAAQAPVPLVSRSLDQGANARQAALAGIRVFMHVRARWMRHTPQQPPLQLPLLGRSTTAAAALILQRGAAAAAGPSSSRTAAFTTWLGTRAAPARRSLVMGDRGGRPAAAWRSIHAAIAARS